MFQCSVLHCLFQCTRLNCQTRQCWLVDYKSYIFHILVSGCTHLYRYICRVWLRDISTNLYFPQTYTVYLVLSFPKSCLFPFVLASCSWKMFKYGMVKMFLQPNQCNHIWNVTSAWLLQFFWFRWWPEFFQQQNIWSIRGDQPSVPFQGHDLILWTAAAGTSRLTAIKLRMILKTPGMNKTWSCQREGGLREAGRGGRRAGRGASGKCRPPPDSTFQLSRFHVADQSATLLSTFHVRKPHLLWWALQDTTRLKLFLCAAGSFSFFIPAPVLLG